MSFVLLVLAESGRMSVLMRQTDWMDKSVRCARVIYVTGIEARLLLLCLWTLTTRVCTVVYCALNIQRHSQLEAPEVDSL